MSEYKRDLGLKESVAIVLSRIIGSGIFRTPAPIMKRRSLSLRRVWPHRRPCACDAAKTKPAPPSPRKSERWKSQKPHWTASIPSMSCSTSVPTERNKSVSSAMAQPLKPFPAPSPSPSPSPLRH